MSVRSISLAKETRLLMGAWTLVIAAGVLSLVPAPSVISSWNIHAMLESLVPFGAMFGIPLLATLAFGSEFQYRTMPMLLAQPLDRREIWREKMTVSLAAVATATLVYAFALHALGGQGNQEWMAVIAVAVVTFAAAPFYTFVARSMIGGLVLNLSGFFVLTLSLDYLAYLAQTSPHIGYEAYDRNLHQLPAWFIVAGVLVYAGYSAVMAWLGRRALLKLQAVDGMHAGEAVLPGAQVFPSFLTGWFRCRARGRFLNLVRREFHLLRIVWTLGAICAAMWTAIAVFGLMPTPESYRFIMLVGIALVANVVIAVLAGAISLSEEKTWGTHAWHMTLPISANVQWAVKLAAALFTSIVCSALVPIAILKIGSSLGGPAHGLVVNADLSSMLLYASLLTLAAFWSACVVRGTVRATVWVIPTALAVIASALFSTWITSLGPGRIRPSFYGGSWFSHAVGWVVAAIGPMKVSSMTFSAFRFMFGTSLDYVLVIVVTGVALIQTHRQFAARREETTPAAVRALIPIMLATFLCATALETWQLAAMHAWRQQSQLLEETHAAIIGAMPTLDDRRKPDQLTWNDLSKDSALSAATQKWLRNASITVVPDSPQQTELNERRFWMPAPDTIGTIIPKEKAGPVAGYLAVVHLANGSECSLKFNRARKGQLQWFGGYIRGTCD